MTSPVLDTDILVAGGGVAGLAATAAFAAAGFRTLCVDPAPPPETGAAPEADLRSTAFLMPSVRLLDRAGLWQRLAPEAAALRVMRLADAGGPEPRIRTTADFSADEAGEAAFGFNILNWVLRRELAAGAAALPGASLRFGTRVARLTPRSSSGAIATLADGSRVRAPLVIAADGRDSALREAAGIGLRRWGYGQKALVFSVGHAIPHGDISTEIHRTGGPFTLVPLPDGPDGPRSAVVWMETGPKAAALAALPVPAFEAALAERSCGLLGPLALLGPRRLWPIIAQAADRLDGPRLALVAEAAHVVPPIGAQGLNMSLRDVAALLALVEAARDAGGDIGAPDLLARYHRQRHPDMLARIAGIDLLNRAAMTGDQRLRDLRAAGLRLLDRTAPLRQAAMRLGLGAGGPESSPARFTSAG